ncbi:uncharacterized protein [Clytia hemisphaerica]|uniref:uncharacterized protein n=1 Tax=Clytia hemisphaerica TaxID=252671 RepID=UPI0034D58689
MKKAAQTFKIVLLFLLYEAWCSENSPSIKHTEFPLSQIYIHAEAVETTKDNDESWNLCSAGKPKCCSCDDSCYKLKNCCVDKFWQKDENAKTYFDRFVRQMTGVQDLGYQCHQIFNSAIMEYDLGMKRQQDYLMISTCNNSLTEPTHQKCLSSCHTSTFSDSRPVFDAEGNLYRSSFCAECNNIANFTNVDIKITGCDNITKLIECKVKLDKNFDSLQCMQTVSKRDCISEEFSDQCLSYTAPIKAGYEIYPNYHCLKCMSDLDQYEHLSYACNELGRYQFPSWSLTLDYSGKLHLFQDRTATIKTQDVLNNTQNSTFNNSMKNLPAGSEYEIFGEMERYIVMVGTSISLLCYVVILFTYLKFKELQNIPGLNTMVLVFSLLISDLIFITKKTYYGTKLCRYFGILMHYLFLESQFWVAIICFDFALTMHSSISRSQRNKTKTLLKYLVIASTTPLLFVSPVVTLDILGDIEAGYEDICWIEDFEARLWSYIVPMGIQYSLITAILLKTFLKIRKTKKDCNITLENKQNNVNIMRIVLKLTIGLGLIEILGFLQIPGEKSRTLNLVLSIIYSTTRSLKGLFLCFLFVFNKKVLKLYRAGGMGRSARSMKFSTTLDKTIQCTTRT